MSIMVYAYVLLRRPRASTNEEQTVYVSLARERDPKARIRTVRRPGWSYRALLLPGYAFTLLPVHGS